LGLPTKLESFDKERLLVETLDSFLCSQHIELERFEFHLKVRREDEADLVD